MTLAVTTTRLNAQCEASETDQISASDGVFNIRFGASIDIDGDRMIVGAPDTDNLTGAVYIYDYDGSSWSEVSKLLATDTQVDDQYGISVAVSGNVAVVGAPYHEHPHFIQGAVYVFRYDGNGWTQEQELLASDAGFLDFFGWSVAIHGDVIVVGAFNANTTGAAYVYRYNGSSWVEEELLTASDAAFDDRFGDSVDILANTIIVGAHRNDDSEMDSGSVYFFSWQGATSWGDEIKVTASDPVAGAMFGSAVSISGDVAIVAANNDEAGSDTGAAYILRYNGAGWSEEQKISAPVGTADPSEFAFDVVIDGDVAVAGAVFDDGATTTTGTAFVYAFDGSSWTEQAKLVAAGGAANDLYGWALGIDNGRAVVCATRVDKTGGTAYIYDGLGDGIPDECQADPCPWDLGGDGAVGINDFLELLGAWGTDPGGPPDFDGDQDVGINDFLELLANWGACP
jgi:hypothetical protein